MFMGITSRRIICILEEVRLYFAVDTHRKVLGADSKRETGWLAGGRAGCQTVGVYERAKSRQGTTWFFLYFQYL